MEHVDIETGEFLGPVPALQIETSAKVSEIFGALAKAQGKIESATKNSVNPGFKSKYATLASVFDACRAPLSENGIAVIQVPFNDGEDIGVATILGHASGEWMKGTLRVKPMKYDAQGAGSVITYLRRYILSSMVGVAPADDDGEAAVGRPSAAAPPAAPARQAAPANAAKPAAAPAKAADTPEVIKSREMFTAIRGELHAAADSPSINQVLFAHKDEMEYIRKHAGAGPHDKLIEIADKRLEALREPADAASEELPA